MVLPTLKGLVESIIKLEKDAIKIDFSNFISININNGSKAVSLVDSKTLNVNPDLLNKIDRKRFFNDLTNPPKGSQFILDKSQEMGTKLIEAIKNNSDVINYFKDKIPKNYLDMLKVAILVKKDYDNDSGNAMNLRKQLRDRYGLVAYTVCNLYSAGYFENFLIPYFDEKQTNKNYTSNDLSNDFISLMNDFPRAIFINKQKSLTDTEKDIKERVAKNKLMGITSFKVHGIGIKNVNKIAETLTALEKEEKIFVENINRTKGTIVAEISICPDKQ